VKSPIASNCGKVHLSLSKQALKNTKPADPQDGSYLKVIHPIYSDDPNEVQGIIFERTKDISSPNAFRSLKGYRWQECMIA